MGSGAWDVRFKSWSCWVRIFEKVFHGAEADVAVEGAEELAVEAHLVVVGGGFAGLFPFPEAELAPVSGGHFADEEVVDFGFGFEGPVEVIDELVEEGFGFAFEHDGFGEEAVALVVARGFGFPFGGDGST